MKRLVCLILAFSLFGCTASRKTIEASTNYGNLDHARNKEIEIAKELPYRDIKLRTLDEVQMQDNGELDIRFTDIRERTFSTEELQYVVFDSATKWSKELLVEYQPAQVMDMGKNPGLGIRDLHKQGITGKGVNIAIVDQGLNPNHEEFRDKLVWYEEIHSYDQYVSMHGPAVTSLAVGQSTGVAPGAKVYYIASSFYDVDENQNFQTNLTYMANAIDRVLEINEALDAQEKIKIISISRGFTLGEQEEKGSREVYEAIERAKKKGIFVITTSTNENYQVNVLGLGRNADANPEHIDAYDKGMFLKNVNFVEDEMNNIWVPMDMRTYASFTGTQDYTFASQGGLSWVVPWLAGMYALCLQVKPTLTYQDFLNLVCATTQTKSCEDGSVLQGIIQPKALIKAVSKQ
ncbi:hypothetical protein A4S06_01110 [Erysipelotrichaceae bacterium MTC7]|nr:hypothetical protein A4S06_01110 [Erysipelotrichaceae bacterium MTC7]